MAVSLCHTCARTRTRACIRRRHDGLVFLLAFLRSRFRTVLIPPGLSFSCLFSHGTARASPRIFGPRCQQARHIPYNCARVGEEMMSCGVPCPLLCPLTQADPEKADFCVIPVWGGRTVRNELGWPLVSPLRSHRTALARTLLTQQMA